MSTEAGKNIHIGRADFAIFDDTRYRDTLRKAVEDVLGKTAAYGEFDNAKGVVLNNPFLTGVIIGESKLPGGHLSVYRQLCEGIKDDEGNDIAKVPRIITCGSNIRTPYGHDIGRMIDPEKVAFMIEAVLKNERFHHSGY